MIITPPDAAGDMALMPSYRSGERAAYGVKTVCFFPGNPAKGLDAHQGSVMLFSAETGELVALMNASAITAIRTAAVSGVATRLLARQAASELAIIGSGVQARAHIEAMACVRPIKRARVASLRVEHARNFAEDFGRRYSFPIEPVESVESAVRGADLIVTATTAAEPIIMLEWISPGAHLNVVGSSIPTTREVDGVTMAGGLGLRYLAEQAAKAVPFGGDFVAGIIAGAATWSIGEVALEYYEGGKQINPRYLQQRYAELYRRFRKENTAEDLRRQALDGSVPVGLLEEPDSKTTSRRDTLR